MNDQSIVFRAVDAGDITHVRRLLHADSRCWDENIIAANLGKLYLLSCQSKQRDKVLGVLCGSCASGEPVIDWIAVHPIYPEKMIREIMAQEFQGLFWHTMSRKSKSWAADWTAVPQST